MVATLQYFKGDMAAQCSVSRPGIFGSTARSEQTEDTGGISENKDDLDVLLSFLKDTKQGAYAPIRESDLCFLR